MCPSAPSQIPIKSVIYLLGPPESSQSRCSHRHRPRSWETAKPCLRLRARNRGRPASGAILHPLELSPLFPPFLFLLRPLFCIVYIYTTLPAHCPFILYSTPQILLCLFWGLTSIRRSRDQELDVARIGRLPGDDRWIFTKRNDDIKKNTVISYNPWKSIIAVLPRSGF